MARLAVICDYLEEGWPSMDLVADMLLEHFCDPRQAIQASRLRPSFKGRCNRLPFLGRRPAFNVDRLLNRFYDYPRFLACRAAGFDLFHICDHSYAQLVHGLPAERTGVFCHDLELFSCLLDAQRPRRPRWFRAMARRVLQGLQKAGLVFHSTLAIRNQIERRGLVAPDRLVQAPYGVGPEFTPQTSDPEPVLALAVDYPFLLHVGSCVPRKRVDVLLHVFAEVSSKRPDLHLVQIGGQWTASQLEQIHRHRLGDKVHQWRGLDRAALASLYRRASLFLLPSEAEGFGLPLIEALACGTIVVASDLPVFREVGGAACVYCPSGQDPAWVETIQKLLEHPGCAPARCVRLEQAGRYSWDAHAGAILQAYSRLLRGSLAEAAS